MAGDGKLPKVGKAAAPPGDSKTITWAFECQVLDFVDDQFRVHHWLDPKKA